MGGAVAIVLFPICVTQTKRRIQEQAGSNSEWDEDDSINTNNFLLQVPSEDIDEEELAAAMMAANSAADQAIAIIKSLRIRWYSSKN